MKPKNYLILIVSPDSIPEIAFILHKSSILDDLLINFSLRKSTAYLKNLRHKRRILHFHLVVPNSDRHDGGQKGPLKDGCTSVYTEIRHDDPPGYQK